jgi:hypothetical protein
MMINHLWRGLLLTLAYTAVAHAAGRHEPWHAVEKLKPGEYVVVRVAGQQRFEDCTLVSVDDSTLTCQREPNPNANWDASSNARLIFPRASIAVVWLMEAAQERHLARWIAIAASVAFVVLESVSAGVPGAVFATLIVGAVWTVGEHSHPFPQWPSTPRVHRRLIYRSATP